MYLLLIKIVAGYLIGSVSGSLMLGAIRKVDIRLAGSGNAGGTNAYRTQGFRFALGVVIIDIGKGVIAAGLLPLLTWPVAGEYTEPSVQAVLCGMAAIVGHCFPLWHGFRGGKGAATAVGVVAVVQPLALIPMLLIWLMVLSLSGWVGLATMLAAISLVPVLFWIQAPMEQICFAITLAAFLVFTHRSNIRKMIGGKEYRFERAMLRRWFH